MINIPQTALTVGSTTEQRKKLAKQYGFHPSFLNDELSARDVIIKDFFIDEFPVTNSQYATFLEDTGHPAPDEWARYATQSRADHPAVGVSGADAAKYAQWGASVCRHPKNGKQLFKVSLSPRPASLQAWSGCLTRSQKRTRQLW